MDFNAFKDKMYNNFRLDLHSYKENQLKRRTESLLHRLNMGTDYEKFYKTISTDREMYIKFLDTLTINVTEFFRDTNIFKSLETKVLQELLQKKKNLKIWSAACSNGAEPYSIAILMEELSPGVKYELEATDIDDKILSQARAGSYTTEQVRNAGSNRLSKYFRKQGNNYLVSDSIKSKVKFKKHDLLLDKYGFGYDLIVCRNVTIYFTRDAQNLVNEKFSKALNQGGYLFIGGSEMIFNYKSYGYEKSFPCFYKKV